MAERGTKESEVTLGTGKLLGIFAGLVVVCAVFFTLGYMLGHGGAPSAGKTEVVTTVPSNNPATKPSAGNKNSDTTPQTCVAGSPNCPAVTPPTTSPSNSSSTKNPATQTTPSVQQTTTPVNTSTSTKPTTPPVSSATKNPPAGTYMVQVAAVSKQEDAEALVQGLRRKQYPVFVVNNVPGDALFHIQVGPFSDPKEAEAMRNRLVSEGYSAIVKK
ncbi:MAG TPA: SPOR domain-containing protein [Candidatus Angelobacter sp.]|nr:SPOR domain-containing protein [Candidatus Angelobacter sp.]